MRLAALVLLAVVLLGCASTVEQSDIDWFVGAMVRYRAQGWLSEKDTERAMRVLDGMNDAEWSYVMAVIGPVERPLEEVDR